MKFPISMIQRILFPIIMAIILNGCTRDDICPEGTATTPEIAMVFNNILDRENRKMVEGLSVETDYENSVTIFANSTTDNIALPLSTTSDTTKYRFIRTRGSEENPEINIDRVLIIYDRKDVYVNRACGFKTEFYDLDVVLENEGNENWIKDITINRDSIIDDNDAHVTLFH